MTKTVKMAVIGVGIMGKAHVADIMALGNTELVAVCDVNRAIAGHYAAGTHTIAYYDYANLLAHEPLDAIVI